MGLKIRKIEETNDVYDITVSDNHNFYANGILVHNCEIDLPTVPLNDINDENGRISLCTLSAINWGLIRNPEDFEKYCTLAVRGLDALLSYQHYPVKAAELATREFRPLGIGIINFAYWLAKNDVSYSDPAALELVDQYAEAWSYYLIRASIELAEEFGPCERWKDTKYADGILPVDTYKREVDELVQPQQRQFDWDYLRTRARTYGIRNATLMALMPAECQSLNNEIRLDTGDIVDLETLIKDYGKIDIDQVHEKQMIGQRFEFLQPVNLDGGSVAYECYYNGPKSVTEIEFEDGSIFRFTENHKLLVTRQGQKLWIEVKDLSEEDEVIGVDGKYV